MKVEYRFPLSLSVEEAWPVLLDMKRVVPCVPGASVESGDDSEFVGRIRVKLGPIEMNYRGTVRMIKRDDVAHEAVMSAAGKEVKGGGSVSATITLRVIAAESGSEGMVMSDFTISGKAAQFGGSVINDVGSKLFKEFANRLVAQLMSDRSPAALESKESRRMAAAEEHLLAARPTSGEAQSVASPMARQPVEALDLVAVAWWSVVKRWLIPGAVTIALFVWLLLHVFSTQA